MKDVFSPEDFCWVTTPMDPRQRLSANVIHSHKPVIIFPRRIAQALRNPLKTATTTTTTSPSPRVNFSEKNVRHPNTSLMRHFRPDFACRAALALLWKNKAREQTLERANVVLKPAVRGSLRVKQLNEQRTKHSAMDELAYLARLGSVLRRLAAQKPPRPSSATLRNRERIFFSAASRLGQISEHQTPNIKYQTPDRSCDAE